RPKEGGKEQSFLCFSFLCFCHERPKEGGTTMVLSLFSLYKNQRTKALTFLKDRDNTMVVWERGLVFPHVVAMQGGSLRRAPQAAGHHCCARRLLFDASMALI
ncbi:MFS general substrate transporter, partial [Sesbania bispinosa]